MKKIILFLVALLAIVMTSCKHETCRLQVQNHYSKSAIVLFSQDEKCTSPEEADIAVHCGSMRAWSQSGVKVDGMYAVVYVCNIEEQEEDGTLEGYERVCSFNLSEFAGMAVVTVDVDAQGHPGVSASSM